MSDSDLLLPGGLTEMRQWALEKYRPADVRGRVLRLCDALEDCARAAHGARDAVRDAQRLVGELRADVERMRAALGVLGHEG